MWTDVLVIGGGPAGVACGLWLHQFGIGCLLLEDRSCLGGLQMRSPYVNRWVPGLQGRTGQQVGSELERHLLAAGVPHLLDSRVTSVRRNGDRERWEVSTWRRTHSARCIVVATGTRPRDGGFVESAAVGIGPGTSTERIDVRGRRVAVLGGGDNAFDQAAFILGRGARQVDIYCRRAPRAQPLTQQQARSAGARVHVGPFHADAAALQVNGRGYDAFSVQYGFESSIPPGLALPMANGRVLVDRYGAVPGLPAVFAAGDVADFLHPCVATAMAHGIQVAKAIQQRLSAAGSGLAAPAGGYSADPGGDRTPEESATHARFPDPLAGGLCPLDGAAAVPGGPAAGAAAGAPVVAARHHRIGGAAPG